MPREIEDECMQRCVKNKGKDKAVPSFRAPLLRSLFSLSFWLLAKARGQERPLCAFDAILNQYGHGSANGQKER